MSEAEAGETSPMSPGRFRECLARLHWSQRGFADIIECDDRLVRRWASETNPATIPSEIAEWLEALTAAHASHPVPQGWRRRRAA